MLNLTLEYQQLAPSDKMDISLIDYLDSSKTSEPQRQQLSHLDAQQSIYQARLNAIAGRIGLKKNSIELTNTHISALQANIAKLNQHSQDAPTKQCRALIQTERTGFLDLLFTQGALKMLNGQNPE